MDQVVVFRLTWPGRRRGWRWVSAIFSWRSYRRYTEDAPSSTYRPGDRVCETRRPSGTDIMTAWTPGQAPDGRLSEQSEDLLEAGSEAGIEPLRTHDLVVDVRAGDEFMAGVQLCPDVSGEAVAEASPRRLLIRTIHNNTLQICSPFVTADDEISLISETITRAPRHLSRLGLARALSHIRRLASGGSIMRVGLVPTIKPRPPGPLKPRTTRSPTWT